MHPSSPNLDVLFRVLRRVLFHCARQRLGVTGEVAVVMPEVLGNVRCKSAADITFGHRAQKVSCNLFVLARAHAPPYFGADPETLYMPWKR